MIKSKDIRFGNVIWDEHRQKVKFVNHRVISAIESENNPLSWSGLIITKEILRDNLGFTITDMADYWQCEKEDFVLIQPKFNIMPEVELDFTIGFQTIVEKTITFKYVHHLQNFYYYIQQKELEWKN